MDLFNNPELMNYIIAIVVGVAVRHFAPWLTPFLPSPKPPGPVSPTPDSPVSPTQGHPILDAILKALLAKIAAGKVRLDLVDLDGDGKPDGV